MRPFPPTTPTVQLLSAAVCQPLSIPLHVDAGAGGCVLPWIECLGYPVTRWDFRVAGVTSISADMPGADICGHNHGVNALLYRSDDIRRHQYFALCGAPGGRAPSVTPM